MASPTHREQETKKQQTTALLRIEPLQYQCPFCRGSLLQEMNQSYTCRDCHINYPVRSGQPDFRLDAGMNGTRSPKLDNTEAFQNRIKMLLRRFPGFYRFLVYTIGPALLLGPSSQAFVNRLMPGDRVLSVGAGVMRLKGNVTHLDYEPYPDLDVVGDAHHLPFPDNSFDAAICESLLEHVTEPERVISEMRRVLKPGGKIYAMMPFMFGFHAAPNDYTRFTHRGLAYRMRGFYTDELKVIAGPASALSCVLIEFCAMLFSLGIRPLYQVLSLVFLVLFSPLKLLDFVLARHPEAVRIASVLLYIGIKR